jgi:diguanylate cyclase (GGDEF)-like protein
MPTSSAVFLSTLPVSVSQRRLSSAVLWTSILIFLLLLPWAKTPLAPVWAFVPIYETWLFCNDAITAFLLFSQFFSYRSRALYVLACGYAFSALLTVAHALSFPGLFAPGGLLGAGPQTTAWLYMFWHGGFPLFVMAYSAFGEAEQRRPARPLTRGTIALSALAVLALCVGLTAWATVGQDFLPAIMSDNHYTAQMKFVVGTVWAFGLLALGLLLRRRESSMIDRWLIVALSAWLIDVALSAVFNQGRYDVGFYAGRVYGLLASSFVLIVLLIQSGALYGRMIELTQALQRLSDQDALTGLANRRQFDSVLAREWRRAARMPNEPLSVLLMDIDHFKQFNDRYGHVAGDACLRQVAAALGASVGRAGDMVARYGGEEFGAILPATTPESARQLAQRLCAAVGALQLPHESSPTAAVVTISVGVATTWPGQSSWREAVDLEACTTLVDTADQALYAAKGAGRNGVAQAQLRAANRADAFAVREPTELAH